MTRRAACCCGQLNLTCQGEPVRVSLCHCLACQQRTGSAFGIQARFLRADVAIEGRISDYVRVGDSGTPITFHFCPDCGSTVFYESTFMPECIAIAVGAFADPHFPPPSVCVYVGRRHPWVTLPTLIAEHMV